MIDPAVLESQNLEPTPIYIEPGDVVVQDPWLVCRDHSPGRPIPHWGIFWEYQDRYALLCNCRHVSAIEANFTAC